MTQTFIPGKDAALEDSIARFQQKLSDLGFQIEEASWLNPVPNVWSVHIRDKECALCFTNGKGATKKAALASALGEYFERLSTNYFFADFWLGETIANGPFVHYPNEKWFPLTENDDVPEGLLDDRLRAFYDPENELTGSMLIDLQSGNEDRGICGLPFTRQSDNQTIYIPMNIIGNLYVSNGMSAGNTRNEARVQGLSEVFERYVKNRIIAESISLPEIPADVLARYPAVVEAIETLEAEGFPIFAYDGSLGGQYPVICVVLFNPANGTCFASFGAHPDFGVALERTVTELLQGRGLKDLDVFTPPTFDDEEVADMSSLFEAYITNLGKYNEGRLVGETLKFPATTEEVQALLKRIGVDGVRYEEIFITSFDGDVLGLYDHLGEYESIDELNHLAHVLSDLDQSDIEKFEAVIDSGEYTGSVHDLINLAQNLDCYDFYPGIDSEEALGRVYIEEMEMLDVPDNVLPYFDFEAYGRDVRINEGGHFAPGGYVFNNGGSFVERYHGMEDIPPEHRIFAYPKLNIREQMAAYQEVIDRSALNEEKLRLPTSREDR